MVVSIILYWCVELLRFDAFIAHLSEACVISITQWLTIDKLDF